jgi:hypothetical protein
VAKPIGSEGFGPHIDQAMRSGDSRLASQAAQWLRVCSGIRDTDHIIDKLRYDALMPKQRFERVYAEHQALQRLCQTVTEAHFAAESALDLMAMQQVRGHTASYLVKAGPPSDPQTRAIVVSALKADAEYGDRWAIYSAARYGAQLGLSQADVFVYASAYRQLALRSESVLGLPLVLPDWKATGEPEKAMVEQRILRLVELALQKLPPDR